MLIPLLIQHAASKPVEMPTIDLGDNAEQSYFAVARALMSAVEWFMKLIGQGENRTLFIWLYAILVFVISILIGWALQWLILKVVNKVSKHWKNDLYGQLTQAHFFTKISRVVPAFVFLIFIQFTLITRASLAGWLSRLTWIYVVYIVANALSTIMMAIWVHVDMRENKRKLPLKGLVQLAKGIIWIIAVIIIAAILFNKSPGTLLAGLGAFAAVLMLVFKDSILGVVAGVQLSQNDSLHLGDWIKVKGTDANGIVQEVSLTAVKIQNFDKTITTLPPYNLVSNGFTNYRPMQLSGTRRIQRSYMIDSDSIVPCDDAMLARFAQIPLMKDWIAKKIEQKKAGKVEDVNNSEGLVNGSIETNLGVFRAYLKMYLESHINIDHDPSRSDTFVSTLPQTSYGVPLQLYCFTNTSAWIPYEAIQSAVFEHIAIMMGRFMLYTNENASGRDEILNGYLESGKVYTDYFSVPYPFVHGEGTPERPVPPSVFEAEAAGSTPQASTPPEASQPAESK